MDFARQLERELAEESKNNDVLQNAIHGKGGWQDIVADLKRQLAAEKERADRAEERFNELHIWLCGCGARNGVTLEACAVCCRRRYESEVQTTNLLTELAALRAENEELRKFQSGVISIQEMHATPQEMQLRFQQDPALSTWIAQAFASIVADCPNYAEMHFEPAARNGTRITVTVQKHDGKTPHEIRREVEIERDSLRAKLQTAQEALMKLTIASCTCLTKTPETEYHNLDCRYRIAAEALQALKQRDK